MSKVITVDDIIGKSKSMKQLGELIRRVSNTKTSVLITGESGTGKELVARAVHYSSDMKDKPFVAVNCGAIPENLIESELFGHKKGSFTGAVSDKEGLFKVANNGTMFLDEIGELPLSMQVKLLRVLQERVVRPVGSNDNVKVDVRVIAATNKNLEQEIAKGRFREDLYYRLNVINLKTPPLRDRKDDIPILVEHFIKKYDRTLGKNIESPSDEAMAALFVYPFPGNVRELENTIERAMALEASKQISLEALPMNVQQAYQNAPKSVLDKLSVKKNGKSKKRPAPLNAAQGERAELWTQAANAIDDGPVNLDEIVGELEKEFILRALEKTNGVKKNAAEVLGITFRSIRYRIAKLGIEDSEGDTGDRSDEDEN